MFFFSQADSYFTFLTSSSCLSFAASWALRWLDIIGSILLDLADEVCLILVDAADFKEASDDSSAGIVSINERAFWMTLSWS